jgi:excisionase family DNA binding protein
MTSTVLTCQEAAERLKCSRAQLSKLIHGKVKGSPRLKAAFLGRRVLVREENVAEWLREAEKCNEDR